MQRMLADERLVAYVDGELGQAESRAIEAALVRDRDAARKVALMRQSAVALRGAFDEIMSEPIPDRLLAVLDTASRPAAKPMPWGTRMSARLGGLAMPRPFAVAAAFGSLMLMVGVGLGGLQSAREATYTLAGLAPSADAAFDGALVTIMDAGVEGASAPYERPDIGVRGVLTALGPVDLGGGIVCRGFHDSAISGAVTTVARGIACRGSDGIWLGLLVPQGVAP